MSSSATCKLWSWFLERGFKVNHNEKNEKEAEVAEVEAFLCTLVLVLDIQIVGTFPREQIPAINLI